MSYKMQYNAMGYKFERTFEQGKNPVTKTYESKTLVGFVKALIKKHPVKISTDFETGKLVATFYSDGKEKARYNLDKDGLKQGASTISPSYWDNTTTTMYYKNGLLDGPYEEISVHWKSWGQYKGGKKVGRWSYINPNNTLVESLYTNDGSEIYVAIPYAASGEPLPQSIYMQDDKEGTNRSRYLSDSAQEVREFLQEFYRNEKEEKLAAFNAVANELVANHMQAMETMKLTYKTMFDELVAKKQQEQQELEESITNILVCMPNNSS